ncbi:nuclear transport factor 2 family protein [Streptomyces graminilatus]|uniref:nuclear transport factor 2 family protein n=1 Tax=Streptomyces graminilatus TaxID=1464070 RepID=UPI0006E2388B|nr:nuclear transport factor 2 family protein [Streptomyces graminilatus]
MTPTDTSNPTGTKAARQDGAQERQDLRRLVDTYASALDRRNPRLLASLFHEDGEVVLNPPAGTGRPPLVLDGRDGWERVLSALTPSVVTTHFVGSHKVRLAGDSASGETDCLAHEMYAADTEAARLRVRAIRYRDSYRRTTGAWRFIRRELTVDWTEDRVLAPPTGR